VRQESQATHASGWVDVEDGERRNSGRYRPPLRPVIEAAAAMVPRLTASIGRTVQDASMPLP
jgi:hypothetical protein